MDSQNHHERHQWTCDQEQSICKHQGEKTVENHRTWWWLVEWNVSWFRECPQSPYQAGDGNCLCCARARRHRPFVRALSSALVPFEINIAFDKIFVVFDISVASAFWIQRQFVVSRPTVRTIVGVDWGIVASSFVGTYWTIENHNDWRCWFEVFRTILKQKNHNSSDDSQRDIWESDHGSNTTSFQGHTRCRTPLAFFRGCCQSMDSFWHASSDRIFCILCEYQIHQWSHWWSAGISIQDSAEITGLRERMLRLGICVERIEICESLYLEVPLWGQYDGSFDGWRHSFETWWAVDRSHQRTFSRTIWWSTQCRICRSKDQRHETAISWHTIIQHGAERDIVVSCHTNCRVFQSHGWVSKSQPKISLWQWELLCNNATDGRDPHQAFGLLIEVSQPT